MTRHSVILLQVGINNMDRGAEPFLNWVIRFRMSSSIPLLVVALLACRAQTLIATDYFLTIGGGYNPSGNQASLEANVVFFQQILDDKHRGSRRHDIYFADGD